MSKQQAPIQMIPINQIHILNPRVRNPKLFEGVVQNIAKVGLKRPITVTRRKAKADGKAYDLVCGQGRLEAFMACGQAMIPAIVIAASEEQALIMSLVENVARRKHKPIDLLQGVELLRGQGYDAKDIATKTGHGADYIQGVLTLLEHGEERLVSAVETGQIPITLAINIVQSPQNEQQPLREAYETGELSGHKFMAANRYVVDILRDSLNSKQQVELALSYRLMKNTFLDDERIAAINKELEKKRGKISEKSLSVSLDTTARASWESGIMPHLDAIPLPLVGKGEQNSVKIKLALESSSECHLVMIEEAENHLSHSRLNELISHISANRGDRQLIITTHSSFVLNKLGIESVILFARGASATLNALDPDTYGYFMKLAGYDTLRLILAKRAILVEGPSDELLVIRAYERKHGKSPLADGVDVITVNSLAFKRFLEIARLLNREVDVVTDNDGKIAKVAETYQEFADVPTIKVQFDEDEAFPTLEPQLLKINGRDELNEILGTKYPTDDDLLKFMKNNKTECALRLFESKTEWAIPDYIARAVR